MHCQGQKGQYTQSLPSGPWSLVEEKDGSVSWYKTKLMETRPVMQGLLKWKEAFNFNSRADRLSQMHGSKHEARSRKRWGGENKKEKNR